MAMRGRLLPNLLNELMEDPYLQKQPPKTAGREQFGQAYALKILTWAKKHRAKPEDVVRTATIFTSLSIANAFQRFILPRTKIDELIVSGGGVRNPLMMVYLAAILGFPVIFSGELGIKPEAKEALAFAVLAYESYHGRANNLPSATGAKHLRHPWEAGAWTRALNCAVGCSRSRSRPSSFQPAALIFVRQQIRAR
jgi:anhydro-N-acetylmuramic acid kinase